MPPLSSTSKSLCSFVSGKNGVRQLIGLVESSNALRTKPDQCRCLDSIVGMHNQNWHLHKPSSFRTHSTPFMGGLCYNYNAVQTRQFFGRVDDRDSGLSKIYEERRVLGFSPEQLFSVVAAVDFYHGFVPWCQRSEILKHHPDGSFDAELEIGFKFLVESYISHVQLDKPNRIKTTVSRSTLFDYLINVWEFKPGPIEGTCNLYFLVDFKFQSPLYRQVASTFLKEVASTMVDSFTKRCSQIYGPEVRVIGKS